MMLIQVEVILGDFVSPLFSASTGGQNNMSFLDESWPPGPPQAWHLRTRAFPGRSPDAEKPLKVAQLYLSLLPDMSDRWDSTQAK